MRPVFEWNIGSRVLTLGKRTTVMGIVNVTPDSFSDGGLYFDRDAAILHALQLMEDGAGIIDVGGESSRPGAKVSVGGPIGVSGEAKTVSAAPTAEPASGAVTEKEELDRVLPVIEGIKREQPSAVISVDTYRASVARAAVAAGAEIVNDISGFRWDPQMKKTLAELKCGAILMHMRGRPEEWRTLPPPGDIVTLVKRELRDWLDAALMAGMKRERIVLDPGFGFGKNYEQNYPLLKRFDEFHQLRCPLMVGISRKSFIGRAIARNGNDAPMEERIYGTLSAETAAILKGAQIIRTHDVRLSMDAVRIADLVA
ncbi:MAG TPA: dihydropteroate synthase [Terriglobales bacterium]|jgi:dihydropteroate synthase